MGEHTSTGFFSLVGEGQINIEVRAIQSLKTMEQRK